MRPPSPAQSYSSRRWCYGSIRQLAASLPTSQRHPSALSNVVQKVSYTPFRPSGDAASVYRELKFPRLGTASGPTFVGTKLKSPRADLAQLAGARNAADAPSVPCSDASRLYDSADFALSPAYRSGSLARAGNPWSSTEDPSDGQVYSGVFARYLRPRYIQSLVERGAGNGWAGGE